MASLTATALTSSVSSASFRVTPSARVSYKPQSICLQRRFFVVRAEKGEFDQTVKDGANKKVEEIKAGAEDIINKVQDIAKGRATDPKKGEVRAVTNANVGSDVKDQAGKLVEEVQGAVEGAVDGLKNALGGNEGYDASSQKGAYTTPQREALKGRLDPSKSNDRPLQKTVDLDNPIDKK